MSLPPATARAFWMALAIPSVEGEIRRSLGHRLGRRLIVGENEYRQAVHRVRAVPAVRDVVGPPPENEGARFLVHLLHLIEVHAGLARKTLLRCSSSPEKYRSEQAFRKMVES
jgi:hypothetical protein